MLTCNCGETLKAVDRHESHKMTQFMCPNDTGKTMHFAAWIFDPELELAKAHGRMKKPEWANAPELAPNFYPDFVESTETTEQEL